MSTAALMSVEEYLRLTEKPHFEYRNGEVTQKAMPTWLHAVMQFTLASMLQRQGVFVGTEVHVKVSSERYLVPDVVAAREMELPYPTRPVLLCCEILSPEDHIGAMLAKCEEYHAWGVPHCWVIDPVKRSAWQYDLGGEPLRTTSTLTAAELTVDLADLFAALPQQSA